MALPTPHANQEQPLGASGEAQLFARHSEGDQAAREALVRRFMPLARSLARRYDRSSEPFEDLLQVASLGLLKALDRFDPERGHPFASFAVPTILGEMRRYFRDSGWSVHVPRGAQERALKVRDAQERLANERGRAPTVNQLAEYLELEHRGGDRRAAGDPGLRDRCRSTLRARARRRSDLLRRRDGRGGRALRARRARRDGQRRARAHPAARARRSCACASSRT